MLYWSLYTNIALARGLSKAIRAMTAILAYLRRLGQFLGFSGSPSRKSSSCRLRSQFGIDSLQGTDILAPVRRLRM